MDRKRKPTSTSIRQVNETRCPSRVLDFYDEGNENLALSEIPTAVYSDVKFENYTLSWDAPTDCTTISGPIIAKVNVTGIGKGVANFSMVKQTIKYSLNLNNVLYGAETYEARVYAIRNSNKMHNEFRYEKLVFTTPPKG